MTGKKVAIKYFLSNIIGLIASIIILILVCFDKFTFTRKATVYLKCPYSSYTVVSQEIKDRSQSILKLDKKNDSDVFAGADGLFYSAKYVSKDIIDIEAIGNQYMDNTRTFKINLKED